MQSGNEIKKAELVRKLAEHAQQVAGVEERMRRLRDKERELQTDEERLSQLKSANAQETEGLLKRQASHLKTSVETEKKTLEGLNKYSTLLLGTHKQHLNVIVVLLVCMCVDYQCMQV